VSAVDASFRTGPVETIVTGGVDATNPVGFLQAGAVAVGIGAAMARATADERRTLVAAIRAAGRGR
jgi:2-keto-3-deoxy-6-phosphogluconate aldolase